MSRKAVLLIILLAGACLRLYQIDFGLPDLLHLDEPFEINRALRLAAGSFDMSRAGKGGFYYIVFVELVLTYIFTYITGILGSPDEFAYFFVSHENEFYLMARITSAFIGIASLYLIYRVGLKNGGRNVGIIAMLLFAISGLHIANSHYASVDITLCFFLLLTWNYLLNMKENSKKINYLLVGLFAGLSMITKMSAVIIVIPMFLACIIGKKGKECSKYICAKKASIMFLVFLSITFSAEPGYINRFKNIGNFLPHFHANEIQSNESNEVATEAIKRNEKLNLYEFYSEVIIKDVGLPVLIVFVISMIYFIWIRSYNEILVLFFFIPYFIAISSPNRNFFYFSRYALPLIPLIILVASKGITQFAEYVRNKITVKNNFAFNCLTLFLVILISISPALSSVQALSKFGNKYTAVEARKWIENNIPAGTTILMEGSPEHRSQQVIQLINSKENIREMIVHLQNEDSGKAFYWELRSKYLNTLNNPRYDLEFIQNIKQWIGYEELKESNIEYIVINLTQLRNQMKSRNDNLSLRRIEFYQAIKKSPEIIEVAQFESSEDVCGDHIIIYKNQNAVNSNIQ